MPAESPAVRLSVPRSALRVGGCIEGSLLVINQNSRPKLLWSPITNPGTIASGIARRAPECPPQRTLAEEGVSKAHPWSESNLIPKRVNTLLDHFDPESRCIIGDQPAIFWDRSSSRCGLRQGDPGWRPHEEFSPGRI